MEPWLSLCRSLAAQGNDVRWFYKASVPNALERGYHFFPAASDEQHRAIELLRSRYFEFKEVYAMLQDARMKDEDAGVLLALQTFPRYQGLLMRTEMKE